MMLEEEEESHRTGNEKDGEEMDCEGKTQRVIGGLPVGDVTPAAVVAALSEYLPHSKEQSPKNRRGRPKKLLQLKKLNQGEKYVSEAETLQSEPDTLKSSSTSCQEQGAERALENGSPFNQVLKGISNQEQGFTLSPSKKCIDMLTAPYTFDEQQVTPFSSSTYHMKKSGAETHSQEGAADTMYRKTDGYRGDEEVVPPMPRISNLAVEEKVKCENDARLHPTASLLQQSWKNTWQEQSKQRGIGVEQQEKAKTAESLTLTGSPTSAVPPNKLKCLASESILSQSEGELTDKFADCPSSPVIPKLSQSEIFQSAGEVTKELADGVVTHEPKIKYGCKVSHPPKQTINSKAQVRQAVSCPRELDVIQPHDSSQKNTSEKRSLGSFDQCKNKLEKSKKNYESLENVRVHMALNPDSSKTDVRQLDSNTCEIQPSIGFPSAGSNPVTHANVKPQKKMGRPRKKCKNNVTEGPMEIEGADYNAPVKDSSNTSPQALSVKKTLETIVCAQKKRGRGRYIRKSVSIVPPQEHVVGMVIGNRSKIISSHKKTGSMQELIGGRQVTDTECTESMWDLKATAAPKPIILLPHKRQKRGRRKRTIGLNEKTSNPFKQESCIISQPVLLPPSKIKSELEAMSEMSTIYSTVKEEMAVVGQHVEMNEGDIQHEGDVRLGFKTSEVDVKLKRKIGRPFKKKTENPKIYGFPENIPLLEPQKYKLKRERKKVELWSPVPQLRRYNRACKVITDYSVEKLEHHSAASCQPVLPSVSDVTDLLLDSEETISQSSAVLSFSKKGLGATKSKGHDCVKQVPRKKGRRPKNKRKNQEVNIKVEEIQQPVFSELSKNQNPAAFQEILPMLSKDSLTVSESEHSTGKRQLKKGKMQNKESKINLMKFNMESCHSLRTQSLLQTNDEIAEAKEKLPLLVPKDEFEGTTSTTAVAGKEAVSHKDSNAATIKTFPRAVRMPQKRGTVSTQIKYEPTLELALSNVSESNHKCDLHPKYLPPQSVTESTLSDIKGPKRRGRPRKNKVLNEEVKKEIAACESVADQNDLTAQGSPLQPPDKAVSSLNLSANITVKRPRKVDRRRKKFRNQKVKELQASSEAMKKPSKPVVQFISQIEEKKDVHSLSQKHSNKRKLEADVQKASDPFTKKPRFVFGSRKRRKRKRSWWDDRGRAKGILTEKYQGTTLEPSQSSVEDKTEVGLVVKTDLDVKMRAEQQSITSYLHKPQNSNEHPSCTQVPTQRSGRDHGKVLEAVECSDKISLNNALFGAETNGEKSCGYQDNLDSQKDALLDKLEGINVSISENQNPVNNPENEDNQTSKIINSGPQLESCKIMVNCVSTNELQETNMGQETLVSTSLAEHGVGKVVKILQADKPGEAQLLKVGSPRRKPGRPRKGDQQQQALTNERKVLRDKDSEMHLTEDADVMNADEDIFVSAESETLNATKLRSPSEEDGLSKVDLLNPPDVEINQAMSSQQKLSKQVDPPDEKSWETNWDGVEQSDQEFEEKGANIEEDSEDSGESMKEETPPAIHSLKVRGPGRPPKVKGKNPVECHFCGRSFHHISAYIIHRRVHTGERPYSCQNCDKTFAQLSNLNTHRRTHKVPGDLHCSFCTSKFSDQDELIAHCKVHTTQDPNQVCLIEQVDNEGAEDKNLHRSFAYLKDGKPHLCSVCGKGFRYSSMLKIHMRVHSGEKPYSCKICGKAFSQACSVRVHEKIHWSIKPYTCNVCGKGFSQLGTLRTHFYTHTGEYKGGCKQGNNTVTFQCRTCNKNYSIWHQYNLHLKTHIDFQLYPTSQHYRQISDLRVHRQSCGKQNLGEMESNTPVSDTLRKPQKQKDHLFKPKPVLHSQGHQQTFSPNIHVSQQQKYQVTQREAFQHSVNPPPQRTTSKQSMLRNQSSKGKWRQIAITSYPSQMNTKFPRQHFPSRHSLSRSVHLNHKFDPRKYLCPRCGRLFRHLGRLRAHMLTHVRGHCYTCGRCGKILENWNKFWLHQRVHRQKQGRFFCPKCGQGFRFAGTYKEHVQEHKEVKVFACSLCPQTFFYEEDLKTHQRDRHRPHKCNVCGKCFQLQGHLERHNLIHRHTHPDCCPHCSLSFPNVSSLQDHMKTHESSPDQLLEVSAQPILLPYQCGECEASFKNLDLLFRHQLCHSALQDKKPWRKGEIVGQVTEAVPPDDQFQRRSPLMPVPSSPANSSQKRSPYFFTPLDDTCIYPSSSSSVPQVSALNTPPSSHQESFQITRTYSCDLPQHAINQPDYSSKPKSLENDTRLPQTLAPFSAVPFCESQPLNFPPSPQRSSSIQLPTKAQSSPNFQTEKIKFSQKPLRTYEKSMRGVPRAPSSSIIPQNEEDSRDSLECAECGASFSVLPELYEHYLQHARGEV